MWVTITSDTLRGSTPSASNPSSTGRSTTRPRRAAMALSNPVSTMIVRSGFRITHTK
jgi:hypothetical protein